MSLVTPPLFAALAPARRVLVAGAGGGFDVYAGLPLAFALAAQGKQVTLANLTFSDLRYLEPERWVGPGLAHVDAEASGSTTYFPERTLARWLAAEGRPHDVYALAREGVRPVAAAYRALVERCEPDALVLVDGGTDILMRGDESGLGTPEEDVVSLVAAAQTDVATRLVVSVGFGIDAFHGVCHTDVLETLAALNREGAYLGALSIPRDSPEALAYLDAVAHAELHTAARPSIVNAQIGAAIEGAFGDRHASTRTAGSELFINPLMAIYFTVRLQALAARLLYAEALLETETMREVALVIERARSETTPRTYRSFPH